MKYRTQYDKRDREAYRTNPGRKEYEVYVADEDGNPVVSGVRNRYDEIQSHRESVELSVLLQRYALGDETALNQRVGEYVDVADAPSSYAEFVDQFKRMESDFYSLPDGFRELFANNPAAYWKALGTDEFGEKINQYFTAVTQGKNNLPSSGNGNNNSNQTSGNGGNLNEPQSE